MKPTSITRRFASTQKYFPLTNHLEQLLSLQGALKSILTRAVGSLSCFFAFCKLSENVAEINNMTTSVSFRWKLERNQKKCFGEKRQQSKKKRKKKEEERWRGRVCEWDQLPLLVQLLPQVTARRQILNNICYRIFLFLSNSSFVGACFIDQQSSFQDEGIYVTPLWWEEKRHQKQVWLKKPGLKSETKKFFTSDWLRGSLWNWELLEMEKRRRHVWNASNW